MGPGPAKRRRIMNRSSEAEIDLHAQTSASVGGYVSSEDCGREVMMVGSPEACHGFPRESLLQLILSSLEDMGYTDSARALEKESGVVLTSPMVAALSEAVGLRADDSLFFILRNQSFRHVPFIFDRCYKVIGLVP